MVVRASEIEKAYRNDMSLRCRLGPEEWHTYLRYSCQLAALSIKWASDLITSTHVLDVRIQLIQIMLNEGHDIHGTNMFALLNSYKAQLRWTWEYFDGLTTPELEDQLIATETTFMLETLHPDHFRRYLEHGLHCDDVLRTDPKIFVPGICGFGRTP